MVLKRSKHGLNTGATLRHYDRPSLRRRSREFILVRLEYQHCSDRQSVEDHFDFHCEVDYSLNKHKRWRLLAATPECTLTGPKAKSQFALILDEQNDDEEPYLTPYADHLCQHPRIKLDGRLCIRQLRQRRISVAHRSPKCKGGVSKRLALQQRDVMEQQQQSDGYMTLEQTRSPSKGEQRRSAFLKPDGKRRPSLFQKSLSSASGTEVRLLQPLTTEDEMNLNRWLGRGDVESLERMVLERHEDETLFARLRPSTAQHVRVRAFLKNLPAYKDAIRSFLQAVVTGDIQTAKLMGAHRRTMEARHPLTDATSIHLAVIWKHQDILRHLVTTFIASGQIDQIVNQQDSEGRTPMHYAAYIAADNDSVYYDLLKTYGAIEHATDLEGYTPINYRKSPQLLQWSDVLKANSYPILKRDHIEQLILEGDLEGLEEIVIHGGGASLWNRPFPPTSLHLLTSLKKLQTKIDAILCAIVENDFGQLKLLLDSDRFAACCSGFGASPLHLAVLCRRKTLAEYIMKQYPRSVDNLDKNGRSPLHYSAILTVKHEAGKDFTKLLCRFGANQDITDDLDHSPQYYLENQNSALEAYEQLLMLLKDMDREDTMDDGDQDQEIKDILDSGDLHKLEHLMSQGKEQRVQQWASKHQEVAKFLQKYRKLQVVEVLQSNTTAV